MHNYGPKGSHHHTRHGKPTPTYMSWKSMISRCSNPSNVAFEYYRKRGITVCERWRKFENFLADMGERPKGLTLDRIDNDGSYEPGNVRWATKVEQANNRVTNNHFLYQGQLFTLANLARFTGASKETLRCRLVRNKGKRKWTVEEAVHTPAMWKDGSFR